MTAFEFVFSLLVLLLGFSLLEVLGGLVRSLNARPKRPLGWLTPMLACYVMLDVAGFWSIAWHARDAIPPTYASLVIGLGITGLYYVAASLVFPAEGAESVDLDTHFFRVKAKVFAVVLICQVSAHVSRYAIMGSTAVSHWSTADFIMLPLSLATLAAAIFVQGRAANSALLLLLITSYVWDAVASAL